MATESGLMQPMGWDVALEPLITETDWFPKFVTKILDPSGVIATPAGFVELPVEIDSITSKVFMSMAETKVEPELPT
jgi:hypothetical protein